MDLWSIDFPLPVALAVVATLGYLFGRRRRYRNEELIFRSRRELRRAQSVVNELERIARTVRRNLAEHHASVSRFKERVAKLTAQQQEAAWKELSREVKEILRPTLRLASQMAGAYDELRQQSANLMAFTEVRTDPLTGLHNRRGLDDALAAQFAMMIRYNTRFSLAIFDIDHFKRINDEQGHLQGDRMLQDLAGVLDGHVRETDVVARYGGEEFVVVMPQTDLEEACAMAERLRVKVEQQTPLTLSGGVTVGLDGDTPESLVARADSALYRAKTSGRNCAFRHTGEQIEPIMEEVAAAPT